MLKLFILISLLTTFGSPALSELTINVPLSVGERLSEAEWHQLESLTMAEVEAFELNYKSFEESLKGSEGKIGRFFRKAIPQKIREVTSRRLRLAGNWLHRKGLVGDFVEDLKMSYFRHPKAFLGGAQARGIFVQTGMYLAGGLPNKKSFGKYFGLGLSIIRIEGAGYKFNFYTENLSLEKVFTPVAEVATFLNVGYEKLGTVETSAGEANFISRVHAPASVIVGTGPRGSEIGINLSPLAFPTVVSNFTGSKFEGKRTVFLSFTIGENLLRALPFLRRRPLDIKTCRALL